MIISALVAAGFLLAACGAAATPTAVPPSGAVASDTPVANGPGSTATMLPEPSATEAPQPTATEASMPTATPLPTAPPQPTATQKPAVTGERISFAAGATSAAVEGNLAAQGMQRYVLGVMAGQLMEVSVDPQDKVQLVVYGADGNVLKSGMGGAAFFRGTVPSTQDYIVEVKAGSEAVSYTLNVIIPLRISFAAGATSAVITGQLAAAQTQHYVLNIEEGQLLEVGVSPQESVRLVIYGADGTVLKSGMGGGAFFRGTVPSTQDYIVDVGPGTGAVSFTMDVIIPVRISFAAGATSASVEGHLSAHQTQYYVLGAAGGQTMEVNASPEGKVRLIIYGVDGTVLMSGMGEGASFSGTLPSGQDYIVAVQAGPEAVNCSLEVSIQ
ncbi:MAG: hypothetical protein M8467_13480 [Anaerolineae bacterium]|nr:hypothetical protein [Anaerolineae bacterium]